MKSTKEIFDYLVAKYPKEEIGVSHVYQANCPYNADREFWTSRIGPASGDSKFAATGEGGSLEQMIHRLESQIPPAEQKLALAKQRAEAAAAELAALENQMQTDCPKCAIDEVKQPIDW